MFGCCWYSVIQVRCVRSAGNIYRRTERKVRVLGCGLKQVFCFEAKKSQVIFISFCKWVIWAVNSFFRSSTHAVNERRIHVVGTTAS